MRFLYIFPHPDDESFGPAAVMHQQLKAGHEVYLLTLTRGGATKQRFRLGLSIEEMGAVRYQEMLNVSATLGLTGMEVLDLPDSGLKEMDPRVIENVVEEQIRTIRPNIIVTYPVHGISGFHDHLVTHAVVKRVYLEMKDNGADYLQRLAFMTFPDNEEPVFQKEGFRLKHTEKELIDCVIPLSQADIDMFIKCLECYETYKDTIEESGVVEKVGKQVYFELYDEDFDPVIDDLTDRLG